MEDNDDLGFVPTKKASLPKEDDLGFIPTGKSEIIDNKATATADNDLGFVPLNTPVPPSAEQSASPIKGAITTTELNNIIKKYNLKPVIKPGLNGEEVISPEEALTVSSYWFGADVPDDKEKTVSDKMWKAAGFISDTLGLGLAQKYTIEKQDNDNWKNALDELRQLAQDRKSGVQTAAEIGSSLLGGVGVAKGIASLAVRSPKLASAAAKLGFVSSPAIESAAKAKRGEELEQGLKGAALGATLGIAAPAAIDLVSRIKSKVGQKIASDFISKTPDLTTEINQMFTKRAPLTNIEHKVINEQPLNLAEMKQLVGPSFNKTKVKSIEKLKELADKKSSVIKKDLTRYTKRSLNQLKREGTEFMTREYDRMIKGRLAEEAIVKTGLKSTLLPITGMKKFLYKFSDNKPLAKTIDDRLGTDLERVLDDMSKAQNSYTVLLSSGLKKLADLRELTRKNNVEDIDLYTALDTGAAGKVPESVISQWKGFFEEQRQLANEMGLPIPKLTNYVPKRRLDLVPYLSKINGRINDLTDKYNVNIRALDKDSFNNLVKNDKEFQELVKEVEFNSGLSKIKEVSDFNQNLNKMLTSPSFSRSALAMDSFASKAREGGIPEFVLDKRTTTLAGSWLTNTFRTIALRDGLSELKSIEDIAKKAGDDFTQKHLRALRQDIIGSRQDTVGAAASDAGNKLLVWAKLKADNSDNKFIKQAYEGLAESPLLINTIMRQIYPNYLGLSSKAALQNMLSPVMFIVPDIGTGYGSKKYLESLLDISTVKRKGLDIKLSPEMAKVLNKTPGEIYNTKNLNLIMQNEGLMPEQWTGEMVDALREGLKSGPVRDMSRKALDKYTKAMMFIFEKSESLARSNAFFMGHRIGKDLITDPAMAAKFIPKIDSPSYQRLLNNAVKENNLPAAQKLLTEYFISNNMFHYNRINMSAFGRYFGPLFSVFSKWPTSIAGRVMSEYERKGPFKASINNARTLMLPFLAFAFVDKLTEQPDSDLYKKVIGQKGLAGWTPADSVIGLAKEGVFKTPAGQSFDTFIDALTDNRNENNRAGAVNKALQSTLNTYMPGSGLLRFLGEDLPIYRGKAKPEGPVIERRINEINKQLKGN